MVWEPVKNGILAHPSTTHGELSFGLPPGQKSVISLGMATRNLGAAFAPLFAIPHVDHRAIVMVALGVPMQTIFSLLTAIWLGRHAAGKPEIVHEKTGATA